MSETLAQSADHRLFCECMAFILAIIIHVSPLVAARLRPYQHRVGL